MKKTKTQKDYQDQMKALSSKEDQQAYQSTKKKFKDTKIYYYGIRILIILVVLQLINIFDSTLYGIINMYR